MGTTAVHCKKFMSAVFGRRSFKPLQRKLEKIYGVA
jgi:hypothetical protein